MWRDLLVIPHPSFYCVDEHHVPKYRVSSPDGQHTYEFHKLIYAEKRTPLFNAVAVYKCTTLDVCICIKTTPYTEHEEVYDIYHINSVMSESTLCITPAYVAYNALLPETGVAIQPLHFNAIVMPFYPYTLHKTIPVLLADKIQCILQITRQCINLYHLGYCYLDIKPANIVRTHTMGEYLLIDYGSLRCIGATDGQATFPPPCYPSGTNVRADEGSVVYGIGVLLVAVLQSSLFDARQFMYENVANRTAARNVERKILNAAASATQSTTNVFLRGIIHDAFTLRISLAELESRLTKYSLFMNLTSSGDACHASSDGVCGQYVKGGEGCCA
jgi:serine/threonine protein kinase